MEPRLRAGLDTRVEALVLDVNTEAQSLDSLGVAQLASRAPRDDDVWSGESVKTPRDCGDATRAVYHARAPPAPVIGRTRAFTEKGAVKNGVAVVAVHPPSPRLLHTASAGSLPGPVAAPQ